MTQTDERGRPKRRGGRPPKYDWNRILDPSDVDPQTGATRMFRGIDFETRLDIESVRSQVGAEARRRGLRIRTQIYGGDSLYIYFLANANDIDFDSIFDGEQHSWRSSDLRRPMLELKQDILREAFARGIEIKTRQDQGYFAVKAILPSKTEEPTDAQA